MRRRQTERQARRALADGARRRQACLEIADGEDLLFAEGHDDAIIGVADMEGEPRMVYDQEAIVREFREGRRSSCLVISVAWAMLGPAREPP